MEIERKFLVRNDAFIDEAFDAKRIVQGYICADAERSVRVRICSEKGFLTIKSASDERGWSRYEFDHPIASNEAEELMKLCLPGRIDKVRYYVKAGGSRHIWEIDVFHGENKGLVVAEIELESESDMFELPSWIGEEVSGNPRYYNSMLAAHPYSTW
jgi:CYTH domain-containing protein